MSEEAKIIRERETSQGQPRRLVAAPSLGAIDSQAHLTQMPSFSQQHESAPQAYMYAPVNQSPHFAHPMGSHHSHLPAQGAYASGVQNTNTGHMYPQSHPHSSSYSHYPYSSAQPQQLQYIQQYAAAPGSTGPFSMTPSTTHHSMAPPGPSPARTPSAVATNVQSGYSPISIKQHSPVVAGTMNHYTATTSSIGGMAPHYTNT